MKKAKYLLLALLGICSLALSANTFIYNDFENKDAEASTSLGCVEELITNVLNANDLEDFQVREGSIRENIFLSVEGKPYAGSSYRAYNFKIADESMKGTIRVSMRSDDQGSLCSLQSARKGFPGYKRLESFELLEGNQIVLKSVTEM